MIYPLKFAGGIHIKAKAMRYCFSSGRGPRKSAGSPTVVFVDVICACVWEKGGEALSFVNCRPSQNVLCNTLILFYKKLSSGLSTESFLAFPEFEY